jgi:hypothetical protein
LHCVLEHMIALLLRIYERIPDKRSPEPRPRRSATTTGNLSG